MSRRSSERKARRILVVTPGAELYGSDRMLLEVVRGFREDGDHVLVAVAEDGPLVPLLRAAGANVEVVRSPVLRKSIASPRGVGQFVLDSLKGVPRIAAHVLTRRPDTIYVNTTILPHWCVTGAVLRIPTVIHVHEAEGRLPRIVRAALMTSSLVADATVFNSRTSLELAQRDLGRALGRTRMVLNAVHFPTEVQEPRDELAGVVRVVYVGRLSERKGVDVALEAVARLRGEGLDVTLDVVGECFRGNEGFLAGLTSRAEAADLRGHVTFHGFQPNPDEFVRAADIVVIPSRGSESFGNVLVEGVGQARPTVAAAQTGLAEAAQGFDSVLLVPPGDATALADGIRTHVERWPHARRASLVDSARARRRHDPRRFRRVVADEVSAVCEGSPSPEVDPSRHVVGSAAQAIGDARVLLVSPHLDDAALSAFALLELGDRVDVLDVLDASPSDGTCTGWDSLCGFVDSDSAMQARRAENAAAFQGRPHRLSSCGLLDAQYLRGPRPNTDDARLAEFIRAWLADQSGPAVVAVPAGAGLPPRTPPSDDGGHRSRRSQIRRAVGPVGRAALDVRARTIARHSRPVRHEDHLWVRDVVVCAVTPGTPVLLYEELPYLWAQGAESEIAALHLRPWPARFDVPIDRPAKGRLVGHYRSQLTHLHSPRGPLTTGHGLPETERYWLWPNSGTTTLSAH